MKKFLLAINILLITLSIQAQAPQKFNYQAVVRNNAGEVIADQEISLKIEILSSTDEVVYTELHGLTTNKYGLINTPIGAGESSLSLADIDWSIDNYKVRVSFDAEGGNNFTELGENQLLSVPYALHALSGGTKQELSINGTTISLSNGGSITLPDDMVDDADADPKNEIQSLSINGDTIKLSDGGNVILPKASTFSGSFKDLTDVPAHLDTNAADDFDGNYNNLTNVPNWSDSIAGFDRNAADDFSGKYADLTDAPNWSDSIKASIPDLSGYDTNSADDFDGNYSNLTNVPNWSDSIALSNNGSNFSGSYNDLSNLPSWNDSITAKLPDLSNYDADATDDFTGMYNDLINLPSWNDSINKYIATVDDSKINEIQDLELVGSTLRITNNASATDINLAPFSGTNTDEQTLSFSGTNLSITNGNSVDLSSLKDGFEANTDNQDLSLSGTTLSLTNDATSVDLSVLQDGTGSDDQKIDVFSFSSDILSFSLEGDAEATKTVDLSGLKDGYEANTDDQTIDAFSLSGTTLSLSLESDGQAAKTVNLSSLQDGTGTDDQTIDAFSFSGTTLSLSLEGDGEATKTVDLSGLQDGFEANTDGQTLSLSGTDLTISGGNTLDVSTLKDGYEANTDDQTIDIFSLSGNTLSLSLESDGETTKTVDLSGIGGGTDDQTIDVLSLSGTTLNISLEGDGQTTKTLNLSGLQDGTGTDDQKIDVFSLSGSTLSLSLESDAEVSKTVDLSSLQGTFSTTSNVTSNANGTLATDDFLFGASTLDNNANADHYSKMFFDKSKSAIRAGNVTTTDWDASNIGDYSAAFGQNTLASGPNSFAANKGTEATGYYAAAFGFESVASSTSAFSTGSRTTASGPGSFTAGEVTIASGYYSSALGNSTYAKSFATTAIGQYNEDFAGTTDSWVATDPLFVIGNGTAHAARNNAITVLKNGNMGINVSDPDATLEVNGTFHYTDGNEAAGAVLTSDASGNASWTAVSGIDNQTLSLLTNTLSIDGGNSVSLAAYLDNSDNQDLALSGNTLSLTNDASTVDLSGYVGPFAIASGVIANSNGSYSTNDFVFGAPSLSYSAVSSYYSKMYFDKSKAAFRAGYISSTAWDAANVGSYSAAFGAGTTASGDYSIAAGNISSASANYAVAIGYNNTAGSTASVALGYNTTASGGYTLTAGGSTTASADYAVALGYNNTSSGYYATSFGSGNTAGGWYSLASGSGATANGDYSLASGRNVSATVSGAYAIGDGGTTTLTNATSNSFAARFAGGYRLYSNSASSIGVSLAASGNSWSTISDSTKKENFKAVNGELFLNKISQFNLTSWNYKGQDAAKFRHYGPMAQDFYNAFGSDGIGTVGCDTLIATADFLGVNFIAIQALEKRTQELKEANEKLEAKLKEIEVLKAKLDEVETLKSELEAIKQMLMIEAKK